MRWCAFSIHTIVLIFAVCAHAVPTGSPRLIAQIGHTGNIYTAAYSADGLYAVTTSFDGTARIWEVNGARELAVLVHSAPVTAAAFSPDGLGLLTGTKNGQLQYWDWVKGQALQREEMVFQCSRDTSCEDAIWSIAYSPDRQHFAVGAKSGIRLWSAKEFRELRRLGSTECPRNAIQVGFSRDSQTVFGVCGTFILSTTDLSKQTPSVSGWKVRTGVTVWHRTGFQADILSAAYSRNGEFLALGQGDRTVRVWSLGTGSEMSSFEVSCPTSSNGYSAKDVTGVAISDDGATVYTSMNNCIRSWSTVTGAMLTEFPGHASWIRRLSLSPDKNFLLSGSDDKTVRLWDVGTGNELGRFGSRSLPILDLTFSPDSRYAVVAGQATARLWDLSVGQETRRYRIHQDEPGTLILGGHTVIGFSADGQKLVTSAQDKTTRIFSVESEREVGRLKGHPGFINSITTTPDGQYMVTGGGQYVQTIDHTLRFWSLDDQREVRRVELDIHADKVSFSSDGRYAIIYGRRDFQSAPTRVWDLDAGRPITRLDGYLEMTFVPGTRKILAGGTGGTLALHSLDSATAVQRLNGHKGAISSVDASSDGQYLLSSDVNGMSRIWYSDGRPWRQFAGITAQFSPNGNRIVTRSPPDGLEGGWSAAVFRNSHNIVNIRHLSGRPIGSTEAVGWIKEAFSPDSQLMMLASPYGTVKVVDLQSAEVLSELISFIDGTWSVFDHTGRFDASNGGVIDGLHWVVGREPIMLSQLAQRYYDPGLLAKKIGRNPENVRDVQAFTSPDLYPDISATVSPSGMLEISLKNQGGGIGPVRVLVNGKEMMVDARSPDSEPDSKEMQLRINLSANPVLVPGENNQIKIFAFNAEGYLRSRDLIVDFQPGGSLPVGEPKLWAVIAGASNYNGEELDLRYAAKDARDFANALELGAKRLFDHWQIDLFATGIANVDKPTKLNLKSAIGKLSSASPLDVVVIYLSGHGIAHDDEYYYLTSEAYSGELSDPAVRNQIAISSEDLVSWLKSTPAQKQIMILDTCAAGQVAEDLFEVRNVSSDQVRAIHRMQNRTGFHVLMGSAADSVSYEASQFSQGLLTYSLLHGMSGPALRDEQFVDVARLFQHAQDEVPELAKHVGGIQRPVIASPRADSFDVGRLLPQDIASISLESPKPYLLQPWLQNSDLLYDNINLTGKIRRRLRDLSSDSTSTLPVAYVAADKQGGAIKPTGDYETKGTVIRVRVALVRDGQLVGSLEINGDAGSIDVLVNEIADKIVNEAALFGSN